MTCDGCKWWSELIATIDMAGPLKAACLNKDSVWFGKFVYVGCNDRVAGRAVDDPCPTADEPQGET
jgi:hypothetical protein